MPDTPSIKPFLDSGTICDILKGLDNSGPFETVRLGQLCDMIAQIPHLFEQLERLAQRVQQLEQWKSDHIGTHRRGDSIGSKL